MVGIRIYVVTGAESHELHRGIQGGQTRSRPQSAGKWHKIQHITRYNTITKQLFSYKFGLCFLLSRKQRKSEYFQKLRLVFEIRPLPNSFFLGSGIDNLPTFRRLFFFYNKNRSSSKVKTGRQVMRQVQYFKIPSPSLFVSVLRLGQQGWAFTIYFGIRVRLLKSQSNNNNLQKLPLFFVASKTTTARINETMLIRNLPVAPRHIFCVLSSEPS